MSQVEEEEAYGILRIIRIMEISASMLELADKGNRKYHELNIQQADMLRTAARRLEILHES